VTAVSKSLTGFALVGTLVVLFVATMATTGVLGVLIERICLRSLRHVAGTAPMIATIGVAFILINAMLLIWGPQAQRFPQLLPNWRWAVGAAEVTFKQVVLFVVGLVLMLALSHLVRRTTLGKAMRATAQDADAARMMGIDVDRVVVLTFFLGSALAGAGSLFFGLYYGFTGYYIGYTTGLRAFTSAVLGGIGCIPGAVLGGLVIGLTQSLGGPVGGVKWTDVFIFALLSSVMVGFAGLLDLGYAAFFAIGAYGYGVAASGHLKPEWSSLWIPLEWAGQVSRLVVPGQPDTVQFHFAFWPMLAVTAIVCAIFGLLFGAPTLRLRGDYLAIVTLGFGEIVPVVARNWEGLTNGAQGLGGIRTPRLFGVEFGFSPYPYYFLGLGLVAVAVWISIRLQESRLGRAWMAIREDELAAGAMGVNHVHYKLMAFAMGAAVGGLGGTFYVAKLTTATPDMFTFPVSVMILVMVVLGGLGSIRGVVVAALFLSFLQSVILQELTGYVHALGRLVGSDFLQRIELITSLELIFGLILVLMMLFRREGLWPAVRRVSALTREQQTAAPVRGAAVSLSWARAERGGRAGRPLLEIEGLRKSFGGVMAAHDITLTVRAGELVSVIG